MRKKQTITFVVNRENIQSRNDTMNVGIVGGGETINGYVMRCGDKFLAVAKPTYQYYFDSQNDAEEYVLKSLVDHMNMFGIYAEFVNENGEIIW